MKPRQFWDEEENPVQRSIGLCLQCNVSFCWDSSGWKILKRQKVSFVAGDGDTDGRGGGDGAGRGGGAGVQCGVMCVIQSGVGS